LVFIVVLLLGPAQHGSIVVLAQGHGGLARGLG